MNPMTDLRFTLPTGQSLRPVIGALALILIALIAGALGAMGLAVPVAVIGLVLLGTYFLVMFGSSSVFDETGIRSRRGVFRHTASWENVRDVRPDPDSGEVLVVYRHQGKSFKIGAPASGGLSTDKDYRFKVEQILDFVREHKSHSVS